MAKKVKESTVEEQPKKEEAVKQNSLSLDDLKKLLKEKEDLKLVLENEFFKLQGQIQFLYQQIQYLQGKK